MTWLNPQLMPYQLSVPQGLGDQASFLNNQFSALGPCWALMKYTPGSDVVFQVVRAVRNNDAVFFGGDLIPGNNPVDIGDEVMDGYHEPDSPGYIHVVAGPGGNPRDDQYDAAVYNVGGGGTGQIFPVNIGELEVWWFNEFIVDAQVDRFRFVQENERVLAEGGAPARGRPLLLLVTMCN